MSILRVHYRERQRLGAADLLLEQDYRLALGGRHALAHHGWGIVRGLRLVSRDGVYVLTPGVAIDGYGRELVVTRAIRLDPTGLAGNACRHVLLFYCEDALGTCHGEPPSRIAPRPALAIAPAYWPPDAAMPDLARARAAGMDDMAPWPVQVAAYGAACADAASAGSGTTRYVGHRAGAVCAPSGRAVLQLGAADRRDFYPFLLSTLDGGRTARRLGIDRDGALHVWRPLHISASVAAATVRLAKGLELRLTAPVPAGLGGRLRLAGQVDAGLRTLAATLHQPDALVPAQATLKGSSAGLVLGDGGTGTIGLFNAAQRQAISFSSGRKKLPVGSADTQFAVSLDALDARLVLQDVPAADNGKAPASALLFRAVANPQHPPRTRAVYATGGTLRIVGGDSDDSDAAARASVGVRTAGGYMAVLAMDGARRLQVAPGDDRDGTLKVQGSVHLQPIGAKDPLLPELVMLAHIGGLRRNGRITPDVTVTLSAVSKTGRAAGMPPAYRIKVASGQAYTVRRVMELVTGAHGRGDLTFRTLQLPAPADAAGADHSFDVPAARLGAQPLEVTVLMLVETGGKVRVAVSNALPFSPSDQR
jgi:hypothetical protein